MANRLAAEKSLYLRQHADNPVDWWPYGVEALAEAQRLDKPVLISIGYSSCHWCHVMAHECFEDDYIARLMNKHFVCIKVDREERPDVDRLYMEAVQMISAHGGWPLNIFCLPDGRPFFGGTYFPPEDRGMNVVPWPQLLMRISEYYERKRSELEENAENIVKNLQHMSAAAGNQSESWQADKLVDGAVDLCARHDDENGGFGGAPKFPSTLILNYLAAVRDTAAADKQPKVGGRIDRVCLVSLTKMARGGLFDQLGGGFFRYSVDATWSIPHFEKMLYDNALLLDTYARAWSRYRLPLFERVAHETVQWLERDMRLPSGLLAAAIDADSPDGEGRYYAWTPDYLQAALDSDTAKRFARCYGVTAEGNFEDGLTHLALQAGMEEREALAEARSTLLEIRSQRTAPVRDDKAIVFWNALTARALAMAGAIFEERAWIDRAREIVDRLWVLAGSSANGMPAVFYADEAAGASAFLDDLAAYAEACLAVAQRGVLLGAEVPAAMINRAREVAGYALSTCGDTEAGGFYFNQEKSDVPVVRRKDWYDNATPAGNSMMVSLLVQLEALCPEDAWIGQALARLQPLYGTFIDKVPNGVAAAAEGWTRRASGVVVIKAGTEDLELLAGELAGRAWRPVFLLPEADRQGFQVCVGQTCLPEEATASAAADLAVSPATPVQTESTG